MIGRDLSALICGQRTAQLQRLSRRYSRVQGAFLPVLLRLRACMLVVCTRDAGSM
jgi:hypothetical protein